MHTRMSRRQFPRRSAALAAAVAALAQIAHPTEQHHPDDARLPDVTSTWLGPAATIHPVPVANAARLYHF
jgi:hypothetical protein